MQSQERDLISGLFDRLKPFESQARDAEAEALIRGLAVQQPAAPYLLVQTVLVQEQALKAAQERIAELEAKAGGPPAGGSGFLGSAPKIGPWGAPATAAAPPRPPVPSTRSPLQAAVSPQPAGGGFLRTAMATAAGVAGGALLFEGIRSLMGHNPGPFGGAQQQAAASAGTSADPLAAEPAQQDQAFNQEAEPQDDYDTASLDDGSGGMDDDNWA